MLVMTTKCLIGAGDEITLDYGPRFWTEEKPCCCESKVPRCKYLAAAFRRRSSNERRDPATSLVQASLAELTAMWRWRTS
jgi:hypothetical protein